MKKMDNWLLNYEETHQSTFNKIVSWVTTPLLIFGVLSVLYALPSKGHSMFINWASVGLVAACLVYAFKSVNISLGVLLLGMISIWKVTWLPDFLGNWGLGGTTGLLLVGSLVAQWFGYKKEADPPSIPQMFINLFKSPAWLVRALFKLTRGLIKY